MRVMRALFVLTMAVAPWVQAQGPLTPPGAPGASMRTLEEIDDRLAAQEAMMDIVAPARTWSATSTVVQAGIYPAADLADVELNLAASNIVEEVTLFGVEGTRPPPERVGRIFATGATNSIVPGDDGDLQVGLPIPDPRFIDHGDGTVTDLLTGLMWLKNANLFGLRRWEDADAQVRGLTYAGYDDWVIPNINELLSLVDWNTAFDHPLDTNYQVLPPDHPFENVMFDYVDGAEGQGTVTGSFWLSPHPAGAYWSSTPYPTAFGGMMILTGSRQLFESLVDDSLYDPGNPFTFPHQYFVWPVRGGQ